MRELYPLRLPHESRSNLLRIMRENIPWGFRDGWPSDKLRGLSHFRSSAVKEARASRGFREMADLVGARFSHSSCR